MAKLLLVDDDQGLLPIIADALRKQSFVIDAVSTGKEALAYGESGTYDLIILDWNLPDKSGPQLCEELRDKGFNMPVLFLTARSALPDKEIGFGTGADDYLTKPFEISELILRIKALLRRPPIVIDKVLKVRDIILDSTKCEITQNGKKIDLYPKEFALLEFLMKHPDQVFSVDALIDRVWATDAEASPDTVRVTLMRLRQKLDTYAKPLIVTIRGIGYRLQP
jgi:DNA-binding response OmpR family regulator